MRETLGTFAQWFRKQPYTKAMYITATATIVMACMSAIMCYTVIQNRESLQLTAQSLSHSKHALELSGQSLVQSSKALQLTQDSLTLQEKEFRLRNRPFVVIRNYKFTGEEKDIGGKVFPHTVECELVNISRPTRLDL